MKSKTVIKVICAATLLVFSLGGLIGAFFYLEHSGNKLQAAIQTIANEHVLQQEQQTVRTLLAETATSREELSTYVLKGNDGTVQFLSEVDGIAEALGISLSTKKLEVSKKAEGGFKTLSVSFAFSGTESKIQQLIQLFENIPYAGDVTEISLTRTYNQSTGTNTLTGSIGLALSITDI